MYRYLFLHEKIDLSFNIKMKLVIPLQEICLSYQVIDAILLLHVGGNNLHGQHIQIKLLHDEMKQDLSKYLEQIPCEYEKKKQIFFHAALHL